MAADLIEATERDRLLRLCWHLDPEGLHQIQHLIPDSVLTELRTTLEPGKRAWLQASRHEQLVALATLMPIVALLIRGLAMDQIHRGNVRYLWFKEGAVSAINGVVWGGVMGVVAFALYGNAALGVVMAAAIVINLVVTAAIGIAVPAAMHRLGRDPAFGSSMLLTFATDSTGFFVFLGLATLFLLA